MNELAQEYDALLSERAALIAEAKRTCIPVTALPRHGEVSRRLREILAVPPAGYALPSAAEALTACALANGWITLVQWTPPGWEDEPSVRVHLARKAPPNRDSGLVWYYRLTWHSRGCQPGRVRLFGRGLAQTPDRPGEHDAPSLRALRAVIDQNPLEAQS
ncbi:hypothetical protein [Streptomyces tsukubensis]|uniref:hypothetical protein n=1 Tax=Streptomyces tsukubensis TaxID=83656 RepID=UPI00345074F6